MVVAIKSLRFAKHACKTIVYGKLSQKGYLIKRAWQIFHRGFLIPNFISFFWEKLGTKKPLLNVCQAHLIKYPFWLKMGINLLSPASCWIPFAQGCDLSWFITYAGFHSHKAVTYHGLYHMLDSIRTRLWPIMIYTICWISFAQGCDLSWFIQCWIPFAQGCDL